MKVDYDDIDGELFDILIWGFPGHPNEWIFTGPDGSPNNLITSVWIRCIQIQFS